MGQAFVAGLLSLTSGLLSRASFINGWSSSTSSLQREKFIIDMKLVASIVHSSLSSIIISLDYQPEPLVISLPDTLCSICLHSSAVHMGQAEHPL